MERGGAGFWKFAAFYFEQNESNQSDEPTRTIHCFQSMNSGLNVSENCSSISSPTCLGESLSHLVETLQPKLPRGNLIHELAQLGVDVLSHSLLGDDANMTQPQQYGTTTSCMTQPLHCSMKQPLHCCMTQSLHISMRKQLQRSKKKQLHRSKKKQLKRRKKQDRTIALQYDTTHCLTCTALWHPNCSMTYPEQKRWPHHTD